MKKITLLLFFALQLLSGNIKSQIVPAPNITPGAMFDTLRDRFGQKYLFANLNLNRAKPISGVNVISTISSSCQAGHFRLYFEAGSIFDLVPAAQTVICKVYSDLSSFIGSNTSSVNIHCGNTTNSNYLGLASSYFTYLQQNTGPCHLIDGQVHKYLVSGTDPYLGVPQIFVNSSLSYHGFIQANPNLKVALVAPHNTAITSPTYVLMPGNIAQTSNTFIVDYTSTFTITEMGSGTLTAQTVTSSASGAIWNFSTSTATINSNEYDFYTVMLHEAMHALGILSLMKFDGTPAYPNSNAYARYDKFLTDHNGNPLISPTSTNCPANSYSFAPASASVIGVNVQTSNVAGDITNCSIAAKYNGSTTFDVYTPDDFELGASLSHFEDLCSNPGGTNACTGSTNWNNAYFNMANKLLAGTCYVKRYLKEQERLVLCDLGYAVQNSYGTTVAGSTITYTSNQCANLNVFGNDDGVVNGVNTYSTTGTNITMSYSTLTNNDLPSSGVTVSCMDVVYGLGTGTLTQGTTTFAVNVPLSGGTIILRYYPKHSSGVYGNATYVTLYFVPPGCLGCSIVNNGGFEYVNVAPFTNSCGGLSNNLTLDCWDRYYSTGNANSDLLFGTNCPQAQFFQLGTNTYSTAIPVSTLNFLPSSNNRCAGLMHYGSPQPGVLKNHLTTPLVNTSTYQVSFWALNHGSTPTNTVINTPNNPIVITIATHSLSSPTASFNFPTGLDIIKQFTINADYQWSQITNTFVYSYTYSTQTIYIGIDVLQSIPPATLAPNNYYYLCFLDEVSINPISAPNIAISGGSLCSNQSFTNLALYLTTPTVAGVFSGLGVTQNGYQYDFNLTGALNPGNYPLAFTYTTSAGCQNTIYKQITVKNCCNTSTLSVYNPTNSLIAGPKRIASSFTVPTGAVYAMTGELIIDPGVKITIPSNATLNIAGSHLYSCANFWQGIEVLSEGKLISQANGGRDNLIEDAEIAVNIPNYNYTSGLSNGFVNLQDIIFNKNYIGISLSNYLITNNSYSVPIVLNNCVFTCRSFTFSSNSWPHAGTSDLRSAVNATTGLLAPYTPTNFPIATLKAPHAGEFSHIGINFLNAGTTSTAYPAANIFTFNTISIGAAASSTGFLLFDAHETFISSINSNLKISNCVFQNTQNNASNTSAAIQYSNGAFNGALDLTAASSSVGNRFWDCHTSIKLIDAATFKIENASLRSSHSSTANLVAPVGLRGIMARTNRIQDYEIQNNEFTNISEGVRIIISDFPAGSVVSIPGFNFNPKRYLKNLTISTNTFSPFVSTTFTGASTNYARSAINVSGGVGEIATPLGNGLGIQNNLIYRVYNGILMNHLVFFHYGHAMRAGSPKIISGNKITLEEDNIWYYAQVGIDYVNTKVAPSLSSIPTNGIESIETNSISLFSGSTTNSNIALLHTFYGLATDLPVPYVICNTLSAAYQGFIFEGPNKPLYWRGNQMSSLARGMTLSNSGVISQQGAATKPTDNVWNGSWTGANYGIYTNNSTASLSPLYVKAALTPTNANIGYVLFNASYAAGSVFTTTGNYICGNGYNQRSAIIPNAINYSSAEMYYIAKLIAYEYLDQQDSLRGMDANFTSFYNSLSGSSIEKFTNIQKALAEGEVTNANTIFSGINTTSFNTVETNTYNFYNLYLKYLEGSFTSTDKINLSTLAALCPGRDGACIYQARALYQLVFDKSFYGYDGCNSGGASRYFEINEKSQAIEVKSNITIFPNPTEDKISISSSVESEFLKVEVSDLAGRIIINRVLKTKDFIVTLELGLINGVYIIRVSNDSNENTIKKLIIAK